ncbi:SidA/IucD/PvdA family monooxygenase [Rhizobium sp. CG5]|uniref:FAD/NAD(P)-binding protein n=1 Tax=Rhizobium sp. CG5 TaxID=2726076 RepID=UPI00203388B9|nr:FAD/NAD(P)-binding protein [Rhizobium sp. CG5]MCM2474960.1 SidA/IucD/PvdA family monooxygenase [Rhizobium sp. CG5]
MPSTRSLPVIAIVGGGFSGAALALHIARSMRLGQEVRIVVFEPRDKLGAGLAYSTVEPSHRINVPAGKMSLYPDDPESFAHYLEQTEALAGDRQAYDAQGLAYPQRSVFGDYVGAELAPHVSSGAIEHRRATVTRIERSGSRWRLQDAAGAFLTADAVVLAVSHPAPALPAALEPIRHHPKLVVDVTKPGALDVIGAGDRVLVVGNGLTSADVVAALHGRGHVGSIVSISRRGLRSRGHVSQVQEPFGDFSSQPSHTASHLLGRIRLTLKAAAAQGLSWHAVLDAVRSQGHEIWQHLPVGERRRLARWVRPYWDVHRFRIAPQVEAVLDTAIATGRLDVRAASVRAAAVSGSDIVVTFRGRYQQVPAPQAFDAVVVTTGPAHGDVLSSQPFLAAMREAGLLSACPTGLGIACDLHAVALGADGQPNPGLYVVGPLARGTFGELMGLPQVTEHAVFVAAQAQTFLSHHAASLTLDRAS